MLPNQNPTPKFFSYDYPLLLTIVAIIFSGLLLLASASLAISEQHFHTPFHFFYHQVIYLIIGTAVAIFIMRIPLNFWEQIGGYLLIISMLLLIIVLIPGIGREVNGSIRWIGVGPIAIQVSEFTKFAVIIYIAGYLFRRQTEVQKSALGFIKPFVLIAIIATLLLLEPDFGAIVVITLAVLGMLFLAGARLWQFIILLIVAGAALGMLAISSPYRLARLTAFLNPWAHPFASGYQLTQSLIAFGRGGIFGVGLGSSIQKLFYLPEAHTDFLFAVLAEELGIIGQLAILGLFAFLVGRTMYLGRRAHQASETFAGYLAYGWGLLLGLQVIINVGVNVGILPTKGLTLPFMSYGGSSMLANCAIAALLLRIGHETKRLDSSHAAARHYPP